MPDKSLDMTAWLAAYRTMQTAMVDGDTSTLRKLITDDFVLIHMTGYAQSGQEWLKHIESGKMVYVSSVEESVTIFTTGTRPRLRGRNLVQANIWGMHGTWNLQLNIEFKQLTGKWLMCRAVASTY